MKVFKAVCQVGYSGGALLIAAKGLKTANRYRAERAKTEAIEYSFGPLEEWKEMTWAGKAGVILCEFWTE